MNTLVKYSIYKDTPSFPTGIWDHFADGNKLDPNRGLKISLLFKGDITSEDQLNIVFFLL